MNAVQTVKKYCPDTYREYVRSASEWNDTAQEVDEVVSQWCEDLVHEWEDERRHDIEMGLIVDAPALVDSHFYNR